jgi:SAM-dependent methyltransferase
MLYPKKKGLIAMSDATLSQVTRCKACEFELVGLSVIEVYSHEKNYDGKFIRCPNCGTENIAEVIDYAKLYENRKSTNYPSSKGVLVLLKNQVLGWTARRILKGVPASARVLDYGCGGGELANAIHNCGYLNVVAIDVQSDRPITLDKGVKYFGIEELPAGELFDIIVLRHVLEHLEHPIAVMTSLGNKLSNSGKIVAEFPSEHSSWKKVFKGDWPGYFFPFHTMVLSDAGAEKIFQKANLKILDVKPAECPILGTYYISLGVPRQLARVLSLLTYPLQYLLSKLTGGQEAVVFVLTKDAEKT